ncbi:MAG: hypothetical protein Q8R55_01990 [Candidatus Taylorbacteria bacterium]|nr:hypothetical protein [Candidatus Taylorbacteria bacterium]
MAMGAAVSRSLSLFRRNDGIESKKSGRLSLPGIISGNTVQAIKYGEALNKIRALKDGLIEKLNNLSQSERSGGVYFWLELYILALCAQEEWIRSVNDGFIASDIPWDFGADVPSISSTIGDAVSYAERLNDPKDHFLKALLLSFSGWTLLSTEKKECACSKGKLQDISVDVLVQTDLKISRQKKGEKDCPTVYFYIGVQSDDQDHLEHHYSFKEKSVRHEGLIIIHRSGGYRYGEKGDISSPQENFKQAEQFRANKMAELLEGLIGSFGDKAT